MVEEVILGGVELGDDHMGPPRGQIITCAPHFHQVSWPFLTIHHHLGLAHHRLIRPGCVSHQRLNGSPHCLLPLQPQLVTVCFFVVFFLIHPLIPNSFISLVVDDTFMLQPWSPASAARLPYCSFFFSNAWLPPKGESMRKTHQQDLDQRTELVATISDWKVSWLANIYLHFPIPGCVFG